MLNEDVWYIGVIVHRKGGSVELGSGLDLFHSKPGNHAFMDLALFTKHCHAGTAYSFSTGKL